MIGPRAVACRVTHFTRVEESGCWQFTDVEHTKVIYSCATIVGRARRVSLAYLGGIAHIVHAHNSPSYAG
jgi:hypothetical protein